jgi:hypothetical protein
MLQTPEKIPLAHYRLAELACAVPVSLAIEIPLFAIRQTTHEAPFDTRPLASSPRALVCMFHHDIYLSAFAPRFWEALGPDFAYLAFHGFASYAGMLWPISRGFRAFRYQRKGAARPMAQTLAFLEGHSGRFALRTDAGGPYGKVRASLVELAIASGRPVVGVRQFADRAVRVRGHVVPRPGATITTHIGRAVEPAELDALGKEAGRERLQRAMDEIAPP